MLVRNNDFASVGQMNNDFKQVVWDFWQDDNMFRWLFDILQRCFEDGACSCQNNTMSTYLTSITDKNCITQIAFLLELQQCPKNLSERRVLLQQCSKFYYVYAKWLRHKQSKRIC